MIKKLLNSLGFGSLHKTTTDFSDFFHKASSAEKKKLLRSVVREANNDQKALVERYKMANPV